MLPLVGVAVALVLRSAFSSEDASTLLRGNGLVNDGGLVGQHAFKDRSLPPRSRFSLLAYHDNDATHKFLHYDYNMVYCVWGCNIMFDDKVDVLRDMRGWIGTYNHTLHANFNETDDFLAWIVALSLDDHPYS